ncbi:unnamed protein product [Effrenium voratum]|uniref:Uncharacterized protein n=1 Tax=Effrenium voratum TaxID=2562239 RepID=A0AA36NKP4_9DINO|nr:unnamed protein product [Effrenium voratum]
MVWELPPRRSWVASTPAPKAPAYYVAPAPPWVPAGSRPLSRPSSARSKSRPQSACSSRPPSAGYAARSAFSEMRPSSPARPRPPPRPSSAPQLKAHGRKYRPHFAASWPGLCCMSAAGSVLCRWLRREVLPDTGLLGTS